MDPKAVVSRFVEEAVNGGHDELTGELFAPELEDYARDWFGAFRASFPDVHIDITLDRFQQLGLEPPAA